MESIFIVTSDDHYDKHMSNDFDIIGCFKEQHKAYECALEYIIKNLDNVSLYLTCREYPCDGIKIFDPTFREENGESEYIYIEKYGDIFNNIQLLVKDFTNVVSTLTMRQLVSIHEYCIDILTHIPHAYHSDTNDYMVAYVFLRNVH